MAVKMAAILLLILLPLYCHSAAFMEAEQVTRRRELHIILWYI